MFNKLLWVFIIYCRYTIYICSFIKSINHQDGMSLIVVDFTTTSVSCIESDLASCPKSWVRVGDDYNESHVCNHAF